MNCWRHLQTSTKICRHLYSYYLLLSVFTTSLTKHTQTVAFVRNSSCSYFGGEAWLVDGFMIALFWNERHVAQLSLDNDCLSAVCIRVISMIFDLPTWLDECQLFCPASFSLNRCFYMCWSSLSTNNTRCPFNEDLVHAKSIGQPSTKTLLRVHYSH